MFTLSASSNNQIISDVHKHQDNPQKAGEDDSSWEEMTKMVHFVGPGDLDGRPVRVNIGIDGAGECVYELVGMSETIREAGGTI